MNVTSLIKVLGNTDIYLIDAIMKRHFDDLNSVLDAGCGEGRNLPYFLTNGFNVTGVDSNPTAIRMASIMAKNFQLDSERYTFIQGDVRDLPFEAESFDLFISSAVMHFAENESEFMKMFNEGFRILKTEGIMFIRMAFDPEGGIKFPPNNFTYLLRNEVLDKLLIEFNLSKVEPLRTVIVERERAMATIVLRKN